MVSLLIIKSVKIPKEQIKKWIELACFSASGRNMQALKYAISADDEITQKIFPHTGWAGYLRNWKGPATGERPVAYIAVLHDKSLRRFICPCVNRHGP